jgi:IS605 OrfB family transposase
MNQKSNHFKKKAVNIKSTKTSVKFARSNKKENLYLFILEYQKIVSEFVDRLWPMADVPKMADKNLTGGIKTWLSARAIQAAGKQASAIVRGTRTKQAKRLYQINKFKSQGMNKKARKLQEIYDKNICSKPDIKSVKPELDSRFVTIKFSKSGKFDGWVILGSLGNSLSIRIPFKKTKHFNKMLVNGKIKSCIRLSKNDLTFMFEFDMPKKVESGEVLGVDIGQNEIISCSNGQVISKDFHGHSYKSICEKLSRKKKGSKAFRRAEAHRSNYINWSVNQLNLSGVKVVKRENIKNMRKGRRVNRKLSHWNYAELFGRLDSKLNDAGVQIVKICSTYTSQRCSSCGWVRKGNRKGKLFKCLSCGFSLDSDLNAAKNISFELPAISREQRLRKENRTGFYWLSSEQELIVSAAPKQQKSENE